MQKWIILYFCCLYLFVRAIPNDKEDKCIAINCVGEQYECINGKCYCAHGYVPNYSQTGCVNCPGLGEKCHGLCCDKQGNETLQCWQGICRSCYDAHGTWICRDSLDQFLLISITQVVMASALVLGVIATFVLLYKLCAATNVSAFGSSGNGPNRDSRLSIGSLQIYVEERLRDPPPRYSSRAAPSQSSTYPAITYINAGFIHDSSIPPPPYTREIKNEDSQIVNDVHI